MLKVRTSTTALFLMLLLPVAFAAPAAAECKLFGGIGTGVTEGIAKFMANAAVTNIIESKGLKPTGGIKHVCTAGTIVTECAARQQGCK